jgi:hypothetical protein
LTFIVDSIVIFSRFFIVDNHSTKWKYLSITLLWAHLIEIYRMIE